MSTHAIVEQVQATYGRRDADALAALYDPAATLDFPGFSFNGRKEIHELWEAWFTAFPDVASEFHHIGVDGEAALLEWTERGTHAGRFGLAGVEVAPTGRTLTWRGVSVYELGDGQIRSVRYHIDPSPLLGVLGLA